MEKYVIEQLTGVNRNSVEGVTKEPEVLSGVRFKRAGGYIASGQRNQNWLGSTALAVWLMESSTVGGTEYNILTEDSADIFATEWSPSPDLGTNDALAYDEAGLGLFDSAKFWTGTDLVTMSGTDFANSDLLTFVPNVGVIKEIRYTTSGFTGGAYFFSDSGTFTNGAGAGTASFTENGGSGLPSGTTYHFRWLVESPTDNGLVVHAIGDSSYTLAGTDDSVDIDLSVTYDEGVVVRFYYRDAAQSFDSTGFERFAVHVSNGVDAPSVSLTAPLPSPFIPTDDVIVNFAPGRAEPHNGRVFGVAADNPFFPMLPTSSAFRSSSVHGYRLPIGEFDPNPLTKPGTTIVYSDVGSVNRGTSLNFVSLSPTASESITGLASTPAGLLAFMENETFLIRGDPATNDFNVQRLSGTLGNDPGIIPARYSGVTLPIYQGELWAITLGGGDVDFGGGLVNVGRPVWTPNDPVVQAVADPLRKDVVARTFDGRVYRMDVETKAWINNQFDNVPGLSFLLPAPANDSYGVRYIVDGFMEVVDDSMIATPIVAWDALDMGDKNLMKLWRRVEVYTSDTGVGTPTLAYDVRGQSGTVTGLDQGRGRWVFTFPRGIVGPKGDLTFTFTDADSAFILEPPVVIEYAPRYRER